MAEKKTLHNFKKIYIEITNVCNLNCGFCSKTARKPEFMEIDLFEKILKEVKNYSKYIYFHVMGEPLLHPDIDTFLDLCHEQGFSANITTNGTLIKKVKHKILSKPALRLMNFSLHSFDDNTHNAINEYLDEIFSFIIQIRASNPDFIACFRLWNVKENNNNALASKNSEIAKKNRYILEKIEKFFRVPYKIDEISTKGNGIKLAEKIFINQNSYFEWPDNKIPDLNDEGFCLGLRTHAAILVDGTVVSCCLDSEGAINLGNINQSVFPEIIKSKRAMDLYNGFSERNVVEPLCRKCGYRKRFDHHNKKTVKSC